MPPFRRALVLLVEDSDDDAFFFRWTVAKSNVDCQLVHLGTGNATLEFLGRVATGEQARPDVIFLDLKLPGVSGFEVLHWLRDHRLNPPLRVVVLSGSEHGNDLDEARRLGASGYYVKPISGSQLRSIISSSLATESPAPSEGVGANA